MTTFVLPVLQPYPCLEIQNIDLMNYSELHLVRRKEKFDQEEYPLINMGFFSGVT